MDLSEARRHPGSWTNDPDTTEAFMVALGALDAIELLCDQPMNDGTPWWVFRDAVREILHPKD